MTRYKNTLYKNYNSKIVSKLSQIIHYFNKILETFIKIFFDPL
ncbi:hypothetical protein HMPREF0072_2219 [Anaerococcus lactolyticus ATCC 51172]|uniref:Uncharacterized protein n=1 Tax=Anaerococcus lactolyticus ATCC 51172 TaxID=525254 RepID=C2BIP9_9FIRM|nr:hypothetical protein HMPREF0072_2219 [Anaerococcus lactolyticus ATCC 51172]